MTVNVSLGWRGSPGCVPDSNSDPTGHMEPVGGRMDDFQSRTGTSGAGSHSRPRRTYHVDEPDQDYDGNDLETIDEIETESTTASEETYPEEIYVEQDAEYEEEEPEDDSWPDLPGVEEEELEEPPPEAHEAFAEGWRARSRVASIKKQRKFVPTQQRHQGAAPPNRQ